MKKVLFGFAVAVAASVGATSVMAGEGGSPTSGCGLGAEQVGAFRGEPIPGQLVKEVTRLSPLDAANCAANR
jgi:hypothetical protein